MKSLNAFPQILFYSGVIDFRKRRRSLATFVEGELNLSVFAETLFVFINRTKSVVRCLYWDKTGFAMWEKELERDKFILPRKREAKTIEMNCQNLEWLLEGVDIWKIKKHENLKFESILF
jgi:transposase